MKLCQLAATAVLMGSAINLFADVPRYTITDLGTFGGPYSSGSAVNETGQVTGHAGTTDGETHAFVTDSKGKMIDLGTLGGTLSYGTAINNNGQVAGASYFADDGGYSYVHAFVIDREGNMINLALPGEMQSYVSDINNSGQVVGSSRIYGEGSVHHVDLAFVTDSENNRFELDTLGGTHTRYANAINDNGLIAGESYTAYVKQTAFVTDKDGNMINLGTIDGFHSHSEVMNENGQVAGTFWAAEGTSHAFVTDSENNMIDLGTLGDEYRSRPTAINNSGRVVGILGSPTTSANDHAFVTDSENNMIDLGTLGGSSSIAVAINDSSQVVGRSETTGGEHHAFITDGEGKVFDLNELVDNLSDNWDQITVARDISNSGYITGYGYVKSGRQHAFLLTPIASSTPVIIDIKPSSDSNSIKISSKGVLPVAIFSSESFDAADIEQSSLTLNGATVREKGKSGKIGSFKDVNDDGYLDLVIYFKVADLNLTEDETSITLEGFMQDGTAITGTDSINLVS